MPEVGSLLRPKTTKEWRAWLKRHHASASEIWLVYWPKASGQPFLSYEQALDEALCWGWIDGVIKRLDDGTDARAQRWSPRQKKTVVSELNKAKVRKLHAAGRMTSAGIAALPGFDDWLVPGPLVVPRDIERALRRGGGWDQFRAFPENYQRLKVGWLDLSRDQPEAFRRRLDYLVRMSAAGKMYGAVP